MTIKSKQLILSTFLWLVFSHLSFAQEKFTISGYIEDVASGEKLIAATVYDEISKQGTYSNNFGFFSLTLPAGEVKLVVAYNGYQRFSQTLHLQADKVISFKMEAFTLEEVEIIAEEQEKIQEKTEMSTIDIPVDQIKKLPALLGEVDVIKAIQLMPGVQSGNEGATGLYVRGGGPDQNLILLDDVPLYYISHLGGFFSVFNADALKSVKLTKGGFPARYGGRLSSVLDIRMKEGDMQKFKGAGSVGLISSKLSLEGPISKGKTSFIVSARRTYLDLFMRPAIRIATDGQSSGGYFFYDLNAKVNHIFSDKDRLYISTYLGEDRLGLRVNEEYGTPGQGGYSQYKLRSIVAWGNKMGAIRWNHIWGPKLFSNLTATYTNYRFKNQIEFFDQYNISSSSGGITTETQEGSLDYRSGIEDFGGKLDFDWYPNPSNSIRFGIQTTHHTYTPGILGTRFEDGVATTDTTFVNQIQKSLETSVYVEDEFKLGSRFSANLGLHLNHYLVNENHFYSLQPRSAFRFQVSDKLSLKASYVQMTQNIHLLANSSLGLPIDLWVPATERVPSQTTWQAAAGMATSLWGDKLELSVEAYYKEMKGLIEYKEGTDFFLSFFDNDWQKNVEPNGKGEAYGAELLLQKKRGKTTGWIGYTLSWNNRQFENINGGKVFPFKYDRRHDISVVFQHKFNDRVSVAATWVYGTGNAITLPTGSVPTLLDYQETPSSIGSFDSFYRSFGNSIINGNQILRLRDNPELNIYENGRNGFRMENYHRLDLGLNLSKEKKWGKRTWNFSIYNAYSRANPYTYFLSDKFNPNTNTYDPAIKKIALFPIIPSISYSFEF